jgi:uncharacterized protein (TIGR03000 family)
MIRTLAPLAVALALCAATAAQPVIRAGRIGPQPAGVIPTPSLPSVGALSAPSPVLPARPLPLPYRYTSPYYYGAYAYSPYYPVWYDTDPFAYMANPAVYGAYGAYGMNSGYATMPVNYATPAYTAPAPTTVTIPAPPVDLKARLTLKIPSRAKVWLAGKEVDANISPLVLESPTLQDGQSYTFDIKVTWEDNGKTEERTRSVLVVAGDETSVTYQK